MKRHLILLGSMVIVASAVPAWAQQPATTPPPAPAQPAAEPTTAEPVTEPVQAPPPAPVEATPTIVDEQEEGESIVGKIGVGFFTTSAPIGIRRWASESWGYDLGLGFSLETETQPETAWSGNIEAGVLYSLAQLENIIVFIRGGVGVGLEDNGELNRDVDFMVNLNTVLGGEFFLTALGFPKLSFTGGLVAQLNIVKPDGGDTSVQIGTVSHGVDIVASTGLTGVLGFHIYF